MKIKNTLKAFTLIELMTVITILGILAYLSVPTMEIIILRQKEKILRETLRNVREGIDYFLKDNGRYPKNWEELKYKDGVAYVREAPPINPITGDPYDWWIISSAVQDNSGFLTPEEKKVGLPGLPYYKFFITGIKVGDYWVHKVPNESGIWDIRYPRPDLAIDGTLYCDW